MTMPDERYRAIVMAQQLCIDLLDTKKTPRVPKVIRQRALSVLRHFPDEYYLSMLAEARPDIIESLQKYDALYAMIRDYKNC
jgi:hypothetical protein